MLKSCYLQQLNRVISQDHEVRARTLVLVLFLAHLLTAASALMIHEHSRNFLSKNKFVAQLQFCISRQTHKLKKNYLDSKLKLSECFDKGHALNVTDCAAKFNDTNFRFNISLHRLLSNFFNPFLNSVCNMWNNYFSRKKKNKRRH